MAATAALAAVSMSSAYTDSVAMGIQADQELLVAENNAAILRIKEKESIEQGKKNVQKLQEQGAKVKSTQKVAMATSGVQIGYGSAAKIAEDTDIALLEDEGRIRNNAMLEAWGYKTQATNTLLEGKYKADALKAKAAGTLLGGVLKGAAYAFEGFGKMKAPETKDYKIPNSGTTISGYEASDLTQRTG
jgi:hypothetical protein